MLKAKQWDIIKYIWSDWILYTDRHTRLYQKIQNVNQHILLIIYILLLSICMLYVSQ